MCSTQIDARKEQLVLAKTELKQAKKEAKTKGSSDAKLQTYALQQMFQKLGKSKQLKMIDCKFKILAAIHIKPLSILNCAQNF